MGRNKPHECSSEVSDHSVAVCTFQKFGLGMVRIPGSPALSNDVANNVSILCILWFSASVVGTLCNKHIMKDWKYPVIVSFLHLLCSVVLDSVFLTYKKEVRTDATLSLVASTLPIALLMGMSKFLTYYSYGLIPISLAHTVKV